jgi:hypothetical protein
MVGALLEPELGFVTSRGAAADGVGFGGAGEVGESLVAGVVLAPPPLAALRGGGGAGGAAPRVVEVADTEVIASSERSAPVVNLPVGSYSTPRSCQPLCEGASEGPWLSNAGISAAS